MYIFFFFNDTATTEIYTYGHTLSLHDALPIYWRYELEANQTLGKWGSTKLRVVYVDAEDFVDVVPVDGGESVGNIPGAWAAAVLWSATVNLDPAGLKGVKIEASVDLETSRLRDPFTGERRRWSGFQDRSRSEEHTSELQSLMRISYAVFCL